jgi:hypothetical protein
MFGSTCASEDRPAVVVPINYEVGVSKKTYDHGNEECWYGGRVLYKQPPCWLTAIPEHDEEAPYLPEDFEWCREDEGNMFEGENPGWWGERDDGD